MTATSFPPAPRPMTYLPVPPPPPGSYPIGYRLAGLGRRLGAVISDFLRLTVSANQIRA